MEKRSRRSGAPPRILEGGIIPAGILGGSLGLGLGIGKEKLQYLNRLKKARLAEAARQKPLNKAVGKHPLLSLGGAALLSGLGSQLIN